jgi:thymidylate synthase
MKQYLDLCKKVLDKGIRKTNRTGVDHFGYTGDMMQFDLSEGFPAVTTKKLAFRAVVAEMLGFLRGYDNAADFRKLGCRVWDDNANKNQAWLNNPNRKGEDALGSIYGVQGRGWENGAGGSIDQLKMVYNDLKAGKDNRREIVTHWNPADLDYMALPPCHMFYQFGIQGDTLNLSMYQRSCDVPLGIPFNIAGYAWLLSVMAQITGLKPGIFTHFMHDIHIYENQIELVKEQISREPKKLPKLVIAREIETLEDLESWVTPEMFQLQEYDHHPHIVYPFSV